MTKMIKCSLSASITRSSSVTQESVMPGVVVRGGGGRGMVRGGRGRATLFPPTARRAHKLRLIRDFTVTISQRMDENGN